MARTIADRMRKSIEEIVFGNNGEMIKLTSSFGLCTVPREEMIDYETLIDCADNKLY